jgi:tRNA (guanine37-N1)-methyltransferase
MTADPHSERDGFETDPRAMPFRIDVFSLFPRMFAGPLDESILRRAQERGLIVIGVHDIRTWTEDRHRTADDTPYGGGAGMVMAAPPIVAAVESTLGSHLGEVPVFLLSAGGRRFTQDIARTLAGGRGFALICGHYEGIDERVAEILGADQLSIGDYVLTGGELPAMVVIDAVCRLRPGVIDAASVAEESHSSALVEYPHYTRPVEFRGRRVPDVLLGGHHARIAEWRQARSRARTARWRPDLLIRRAPLSSQRAARSDDAAPVEEP